MRPPEPILVINDGSVAALVACLLAPELSKVTVWVPPAGSSLRGVGADEASQMSLVSQQSDLLGYERVVTPAPLARPVAERWIEQPASLLLALADARRLGCTRVVWPVVHGESPAEMLEAAERAALVNRLCWLGEPERAASDPGSAEAGGMGGAGGQGGMGAGPQTIRLETPFVDLTPSQVMDMARDLDAPLQTCWWDAGVMV